jgi:ketopantoate reductase
MDWNMIANTAFQIVIIPLLSALTAFLVKLIQTKTQSIKSKIKSDKAQKYADMLSQTIIDCVIATNQTYTNIMKDQNLFDAEAQKYAFNMTYNAVMALLTDEAKKYLEEFYGNLDVYVREKIEAEVNNNRNLTL